MDACWPKLLIVVGFDTQAPWGIDVVLQSLRRIRLMRRRCLPLVAPRFLRQVAACQTPNGHSLSNAISFKTAAMGSLWWYG